MEEFIKLMLAILFATVGITIVIVITCALYLAGRILFRLVERVEKIIDDRLKLNNRDTRV